VIGQVAELNDKTVGGDCVGEAGGIAVNIANDPDFRTLRNCGRGPCIVM
jgi:hypothetical protein